MLPASGARTRVRSPFLMFSKKKGVGFFFSWGGLPTTQPPTSVRSFFFENRWSSLHCTDGVTALTEGVSALH